MSKSAALGHEIEVAKEALAANRKASSELRLANRALRDSIAKRRAKKSAAASHQTPAAK